MLTYATTFKVAGMYSSSLRITSFPTGTKGEFIKLGVLAVVDRVIQQAIAQELSLIFEEQFLREQFWFQKEKRST